MHITCFIPPLYLGKTSPGSSATASTKTRMKALKVLIPTAVGLGVVCFLLATRENQPIQSPAEKQVIVRRSLGPDHSADLQQLRRDVQALSAEQDELGTLLDSSQPSEGGEVAKVDDTSAFDPQAEMDANAAAIVEQTEELDRWFDEQDSDPSWTPYPFCCPGRGRASSPLSTRKDWRSRSTSPARARASRARAEPRYHATSSFVIRHSSFVIRHSSFVIRHSSFVIRHSHILAELVRPTPRGRCVWSRGVLAFPRAPPSVHRVAADRDASAS
jgi:hypothetical protein